MYRVTVLDGGEAFLVRNITSFNKNLKSSVRAFARNNRVFANLLVAKDGFNITVHNIETAGYVLETGEVARSRGEIIINLHYSLFCSLPVSFGSSSGYEEGDMLFEVNFNNTEMWNVEQRISVIDDGEAIDYSDILSIPRLSCGEHHIQLMDFGFSVVNVTIYGDEDTLFYDISLYDTRRNSWGEFFSGEDRFYEQVILPVKEAEALPLFVVVDEGELPTAPSGPLNNIFSSSRQALSSTLVGTGDIIHHGRITVFMYCYILKINKCLEESNINYTRGGNPPSFIGVFEQRDSNHTLSLSYSKIFAEHPRPIQAITNSSPSIIFSAADGTLVPNVPCGGQTETENRCSAAVNGSENKVLITASAYLSKGEEHPSLLFLKRATSPPAPILFRNDSMEGCLNVERDCIRVLSRFRFSHQGSHYPLDLWGTSLSTKVVTAYVNALRGRMFGTNTSTHIYTCSFAVMKAAAEDRGAPGPDLIWGVGLLSATDLFDEFGKLKSGKHLLDLAKDEGYLSDIPYEECLGQLII